MISKRKNGDKIISVDFAQGLYYNAKANKEKNTLGQKIAQVRKARGLSLVALSKLLGDYGISIQSQSLNKWELGLTVPSAYQLIALCHALQIEDGFALFSCGATIQHELNEAGMKKLRDYKDDLIASGRYTVRPAMQGDHVKYKNMPVSILPVSAGTGTFLDEGTFEMVSIPEASIPTGAEFGVWVSGDSMEPVYRDGQIVWVQPCEDLAPGEVGVFIYDGDGYLKVYGERQPDDADAEDFTDSYGTVHAQHILISYNKIYEPKLVSPNRYFRVVGRVLN